MRCSAALIGHVLSIKTSDNRNREYLMNMLNRKYFQIKGFQVSFERQHVDKYYDAEEEFYHLWSSSWRFFP